MGWPPNIAYGAAKTNGSSWPSTLERAHERDDGRRIENRGRTVGQDFALERPLPVGATNAGLWLTLQVDRHARVMVRQCYVVTLNNTDLAEQAGLAPLALLREIDRGVACSRSV